jgi:FlaA1/EpsC-like NDP-sugar epimerase
MIRLAGFEPGEEIEIRYTGVRPGEKLYEELNLDDECLQPTYHEKILIFKGAQVDAEVVSTWAAKLRQLTDARNEEETLRHLQRLVPEYRPMRPAREEGLYVSKVASA